MKMIWHHSPLMKAVFVLISLVEENVQKSWYDRSDCRMLRFWKVEAAMK